MQLKWIENSFTYDGSQLHSLYAYLNHYLLGDSIIAWQGPCSVSFEHMVDGEDLLDQSPIEGDDMVHFIIEKFDCDLYFGVSMQRLLAAHTIQVLKELSPNTELTHELTRDGDDVFCKYKKFSISVATKSPNSTLVHFAVNVVNEGTPVDTISLSDFQIEPSMFAKHLMQIFIHEIQSITDATRKVKWVK